MIIVGVSQDIISSPSIFTTNTVLNVSWAAVIPKK
nr:MAG TPA: hypothetical protein [Bacteriophage sp.]